MLHRDICLENLVVVDPERGFDSIKLIDFGSSCSILDDKPVEDNLGDDLVGTLEFCAPEVVSEQVYSYESDYWSIGVVAYALLSGIMPFYADTKGELTEQIENGNCDFRYDEWWNVGHQAKDFVQRLLARDPRKRPKPE